MTFFVCLFLNFRSPRFGAMQKEELISMNFGQQRKELVSGVEQTVYVVQTNTRRTDLIHITVTRLSHFQIGARFIHAVSAILKVRWNHASGI